MSHQQQGQLSGKDKNEKIVLVNKTGGPELRRLNAIESNNTTVGE